MMTQVEQRRKDSTGNPANQRAIATLLLHEGSALADLDLQESMLVAYEQAIQLAPYEGILHLHRGHVLEQMGKKTEAQRAYEEAHRLGYDFVSSYEEEGRS